MPQKCPNAMRCRVCIHIIQSCACVPHPSTSRHPRPHCYISSSTLSIPHVSPSSQITSHFTILPLLMLRILATNNIHISTLLPPHALAPIAQLLDRAAHFHAPDLWRSLQAHAIEACGQVGEWLLCASCAQTRAEQSVAGACWCVDVASARGEAGGWEDGAAQRVEERAGEHFGRFAMVIDGGRSRC
jgi:hypothetical protein